MAVKSVQIGRKVAYSNRGMALQNPSHHTFKPGVGYLNRGPIAALPSHRAPPDRCNPPLGIIGGSWHGLRAPNNGPVLNFRWISGSRTWLVAPHMGTKARRIGFTAEYLSRAGWAYKGPAQNAHS